MRTQKKEAARPGAAVNDAIRPTDRITERWCRVSRREPCPICGHEGWCVISPDRAVAGCMRVDDGSFRTSETQIGPMFLHHLRERARCASRLRFAFPPMPLRSLQTSGWQRTLASNDHRNAVYAALLEKLKLSAAHDEELRSRRGLSEETITRNQYASVPDREAFVSIVCELAEEFYVATIPGFFLQDGRWQCVARPGELLIPVRDERERITAIIRSTGKADRKYLWMSDGSRSASCGTPITFALPFLGDLHPGSKIIITEGILKADVIAEHLHQPVVGCPGTVIPDDIGSRLAARFPTMAGVSVAFDADESRNQHVRRAVIRLLQLLSAAGISADRLIWDEALGKGLDDVLLGGAK